MTGDKVDGACSMHEEMHKIHYSEDKKGRDNFGHLSVDAGIILKCINKVYKI
jgi:hypothetical protein